MGKITIPHVANALWNTSRKVIEYKEFFYPIGELLVGVGMLTPGIVVFVARSDEMASDSSTFHWVVLRSDDPILNRVLYYP